MTTGNGELVRQAYEDFNKGGVEAIIEFLDPEIEWRSVTGMMPDAQTYHGREGVRRWFAKIYDVFEEVRFVPQEIIDAPDGRVFVALSNEGRGKASGISGEIMIYQVWTEKDGKAITLDPYLDRDEALRAAGLA